MKVYELSEDQFQEVMRLSRLYHKEAEKCMEAKAYLAGCVMIGATLEAVLIGMCHCYTKEIPAGLVPKKRNGRPKCLLDWSLSQLIRVARECDWLPSGLPLEDDWDHKKAQIGDYAIILKEFRNLVHAGCHITYFKSRKVTVGRMKICFDVLDATIDHLQAKIGESLKKAIEE